MHLNYDVVIVGAGPAGGQCARELAEKGKRVLLVEKAKDFTVNNYSSGGAPAEILQDYNLPQDVVGANWHKIALYTSSQRHEWQDLSYQGLVLDFMKLRAFLAEQVKVHGSEVLLDHSYHHHEEKEGKTIVYFRSMHGHDEKSVTTKVLVDATGAERKILQHGKFAKEKIIAATGIEYLVEVNRQQYQRYAQALSFFLGLKWMPQGYSWIFPMEQDRLKIGIIRYFSNEQVVSHEPSYRYYLDQMLEDCLDKTDYKILDTHGKTMYYRLGQKDLITQGNVVAIGDSISTLNPMASEGIRHAMYSGKIAAKCIVDYLDKKQSGFQPYIKGMRRYFGLRWKTSEYIMNCMYREKDDQCFENYAEAFKKLSFNEMLDFSFKYKFRIICKFFWHFLALRLGKKRTLS